MPPLRWIDLIFYALLICGTSAWGGLAENERYRAALGALEDRLPALAIPRLQDALRDFPEDSEARRIIHRKLGEASVRAARRERDRGAMRARALYAREALSHPDLANDEAALFWSAQASLLLNDLSTAEALFGRLAGAEDREMRTRAKLTRAQVLMKLGRRGEGESLLADLSKSSDPDAVAEALLLRASFLLSVGELAQADELLATIADSESEEYSMRARYLQAQLAVVRGDYEAAGESFGNLAAEPGALGTRLHHGAILGQIEALHLTGRTDEAVDRIIRFLSVHPRSPLLEEAFARLLKWAQDSPTLEGRVEAQVTAWCKLDDERAGFARYYFARHLAEQNAPESNLEAEKLLAELPDDLPRHPLVSASFIETARLQSANGRITEAISTLEELERRNRGAGALRGEAAKLIALLSFKEGNFDAAADAFVRARKSLEGHEAEVAGVNAGVSLLYAEADAQFEELLSNLQSSEAGAALELERALLTASRHEEGARPLLRRFISKHNEHPRVADARLALAEEWLHHDPNETAAQDEAGAQLAAIDPTQLSTQLALRHLLARLRLAELTGSWKLAIEEGKRFIDAREPEEVDPAVQLKLAEAYYNAGQLDRAQLAFKQVANKVKEGPLFDVATFFAARAALELGTENSPEEAATLLKQIIESGGMLANDARLLLARSLIKPSPREALSTLGPLLAEDSPEDSALDALVLAAEAHRALGTEEDYRAAIKIYDRILNWENLSYADSNRLHSLKGQVYELLGDPGAALDTYYRVIIRENLPVGEEPSEWRWFGECGFKAVQILEEGKDWPAALELLHKLEQSGGPWRKRARDRRKALQLERLQWDPE